MARQQVVSYTVTCDVCGEILDGDTQTASRKISWEGSDYVVDMCTSDQEALGAVLGQLKVFVDAGSEKAMAAQQRRPGAVSASKAKAKANGRAAAPGRGAVPKPAPSGEQSRMPVIRAWALENGHQVGHRGRIPAGVVAAYDQAQAGPTEAPAPKKRRPRKAAAVAAPASA
jgi:hypothetical protein